MPTYEYACTECGEQTEVVQKFTDDPLTVCSHCGGRLRKVFSPVGIVFKGAGFYRTDSRAAPKEPVAAGQQNGSADGAKSAGDKSSEPSRSGAKDTGSSGSSGTGSSSGASSGGSSGSGSSGSGSSGSGSSGSGSSRSGSSGGSGSRGPSSGGKPSSTKVA